MSMKQQSGFTLIEVLVATLVLTVGILGVAAMQMVSFQTNQSAYARSQAVYLAQDIFDRMRANPAGYRSTTVYNSVDTTDTSTIPGDPSCVTTNGGCSPQQMGQQDLREWADAFYNVTSRDEYRPRLPNGSASLDRIGTTDEFEVIVSWDDRDFDTEGNLTRSMVTRSVTIRAMMN